VSTRHFPQHLDLDAAAEVVAISPGALRALAGAGYVVAARDDRAGPTFAMADLRAFVARNATNGSGVGVPANIEDVRTLNGATPDLEPQELVELLDERAEHMALQMLKMYATVFPQAGSWSLARQHKFVQRTKSRFEAMLAVTALGEQFEPQFFDDLRMIGASAAKSGVKLPQILAMLRVSRDLVVQNAVELADNTGRQGGHALSLLLTRILPAVDGLGDALTAGYWEAMFPG
jgi:hypothetical protein